MMFKSRRKAPTLAEKLETCTSLEELDGMVKALSGRGVVLTQDEQAAVARARMGLAK